MHQNQSHFQRLLIYEFVVALSIVLPHHNLHLIINYPYINKCRILCKKLLKNTHIRYEFLSRSVFSTCTCTTKLILLKIPCLYGHRTDINLVHKKSFSILLIWHNCLKFVLEEHSCFHEKFTKYSYNKRGFLRTFGLFESQWRPYIMRIEVISRENVDSGKYVNLIPLCWLLLFNILDRTHSI